MITNFERITSELTQEEKTMIQGLMLGLGQRRKENPIKAPEIVSAMNLFAERHGCKKITDVRLRKMINFIRSQGMQPIIATSEGYYVSYDEADISDQIKSLTERANSILDCVHGLKKFLPIK